MKHFKDKTKDSSEHLYLMIFFLIQRPFKTEKKCGGRGDEISTGVDQLCFIPLCFCS